MEDLDLLQQKLKQMRILENVELPSLVLELLAESEKSSVVDTAEETETSDEETESSDEEDELEEESETEPEGSLKKPDLKPPEMVRMANLCRWWESCQRGC